MEDSVLCTNRQFGWLRAYTIYFKCCIRMKLLVITFDRALANPKFRWWFFFVHIFFCFHQLNLFVLIFKRDTHQFFLDPTLCDASVASEVLIRGFLWKLNIFSFSFPFSPSLSRTQAYWKPLKPMLLLIAFPYRVRCGYDTIWYDAVLLARRNNLISYVLLARSNNFAVLNYPK